MTEPAPGAQHGREVAWLERLRDLSHRLAEEWDVARLLPAILDAAIELTGAERGYLVLVEGRTERGGWRFQVSEARGFDKAALRGAEGKVSRTVVKRIMEGDAAGLVTTRERDVLAVSSVQARHVVAIACVPLRVRGETRGALYLDHLHDPDAFTEADLPVLSAFADQAALALSTAELLAQRARDAAALEAATRDLQAARAALDAPAPPASPPARAALGRLVGATQVMQALYEEVEHVARGAGPVLVHGEAGAGKLAVARELHARGARPDAPFVVVTCADEGASAELFGGVPGHAPALVAAGEGTVVLREVADLPLAAQGKLLRALQGGALPPGAAPLRARLVATTGHDLQGLVRAGRFRADLFYRLDVLRVFVPPLRDRRDDVPLLLEHFFRQAGRRLNLTPAARELLTGYAWPGNVRQLENEAMRLLVVPAPQLTAQHLSPEVREGRGVTAAPARLGGKTLGEVERTLVEAALRECRGNKARAARQLGIPRSTLYGLLVRYGLDGEA